jgi:cyclopropane-fatty-acyl-phospholipid synthase
MNEKTAKTGDMVLEQTYAILERLFPSPRDFSIQLWGEMEIPADTDGQLILTLNHPGALRRMIVPPIELSIGEAYIYGDFDIQGDIFVFYGYLTSLLNHSFTATEATTLIREIQHLPDTGPTHQITRQPASLHGKLHSRERDLQAIRFHYNVSNEFYALWLDPLMQYSCAYFESGNEDLETAQAKKIEYLCRKLRLKPGERLLDIGCGWGGLAITAAKNFGVEVLGVTLSDKQATFAQEKVRQQGLAEQVRIEIRDYRDLENASFDKIVSVGMFEHVGRTHLPEYFTQVHRLLKPGGLFLNVGISRRANPGDLTLLKGLSTDHQGPHLMQSYFERKVLGLGSFSQHYIFPDGELVPISEANLIAESAGFEVRDVEDLREHYALTLHKWVNRLEAHHAEAAQLVGESVYRTWRLYMSFSAFQFESWTISIHQSLLAKPEHGKVGLPMSRVDLYD